MAERKVEIDRTEYCEECRKYHLRPTWRPGRPCEQGYTEYED